MAMYDPVATDSSWNDGLETVEMVFLFLFTFEVAFKLVGLQLSFFRDGWNQMDFIIVATGYLVFLPGDTVHTSVFRTIRVLRPLRSIGMMPGVRILIDSLIYSLPGLSSVALLIIFIFTIFGVMGVQLFGGSFRSHCVPAMHCLGNGTALGNVTGLGNGTILGNGVYGVRNPSYMEYGACMSDADCASQQCVAVVPPASIAVGPPESLPWIPTGLYGFCRLENLEEYGCEDWQVCQKVSVDLHHGATSFDHIGGAFVILFQLCTTEGWTTIMAPTLQTNSATIVYIYFGFALLTTSFFLVNFVMAQMVVAFERCVEDVSHRPPEPSTLDALLRRLKAMLPGSTPMHEDVWSMRAMFIDRDTDDSGFLDSVEVEGLSEALNFSPPLTIEEMDEDGNGQISYAEFEAWWKMRKAFDNYDADGNHVLDITEAEKVARDLNMKFDFEEMDVDGSGTVSYAEFKVWWNLRKHFDALDKTRDGCLSGSELETLSKQLSLPQTFIDTFLEKGDANKDETYSFHEFSLWWQLYKTFTAIDVDNSGTIDESEFEQLGKDLQLDGVSMGDVSTSGMKVLTFKDLLSWWALSGKEHRVALLMSKHASRGAALPKDLRSVVNSYVFGNAVTAVVIFNFVVLAYDHQGISDEQHDMVEILNLVFTIFFTLEMLLKLVGLGLRDYFVDRFNVLDFFIVVTSLIEIALGDEGAITVMRTLRLLRVLRSVRIFSTIKSLRHLLEVTMRSGAAILNFGLLIFTFLVIYALVGLHLFGGTMTSPMYTAAGRFDGFYYAFLTVTQVLTRENWHELLYVSYNNHGFGAFVYFASLISIANYMILSLFLGNMLHNLNVVFLAEAKRIAHDAEKRAKSKVVGRNDKKSSDSKERSILSFESAKLGSDMPVPEKELNAALIIQREWYRRMGLIDENVIPQDVEKSFMLFSLDNPVRAFCLDIATSTIFDTVMLLFITATAFAFVFEKPGSTMSDGDLNGIDVVVAVIFTLEVILLWIAFGLFGAPNAYFSSAWHSLDFSICVLSLVTLAPAGHEFRVIRIVRLLRVVRVLRSLKWMPGLHRITGAMLEGLVPIVIVGGIALFAASIFAVALVSMLKGKLYSCSESFHLVEDNSELSAMYQPYIQSDMTYLTWEQCNATEGATWVNNDQNFDNFGASLLTMFEMMTLEDWQSVMYACMDTTETLTSDGTYERIYRGSPATGLVFVLFILVGSFFFLNLFLGVVTSAMEMLDASPTATLLFDKDRAQAHVYRILSASPLDTRTGCYRAVRRPCLNLVQSTMFQVVVALGILLNVSAMTFETFDQPQWKTDLLIVVNVVFTFFFTAEIVFKLLAYLPKRCLRDPWNTFDLFIVLLGWVELIAKAADVDSQLLNPTIFRSFRILRLTRLLKLVPKSEGLQLIFRTFVDAMPLLGTVTLLIVLIMFCYTTLCVQLFGLVEPSGGEMDDLMNFRDFWRAWFTLCVLSTGEHWNAVMHELRVSKDGPGGPATVAVFLTFQFSCVFLVLNLFVSVVVVAVQHEEKEHHEELERQKREGKEEIGDRDLEWSHLDEFTDAWATQDPSGSGLISDADAIQTMMMGLPGRTLTRGVDVDTRLVVELGKAPYQFHEVLLSLSARAFELDVAACDAAMAHNRGVMSEASPMRGAASDAEGTKFVNPMLGMEADDELKRTSE
jgi:Ca2+-binding EF-hand superfamily protein